MKSASRSCLLLAAAAIAVVVIGSSPAAAHEGDGVFTVESTTPGKDGTVTYQVRLTWENDGHPAIDSTVTATAVGPDGTTQTPVTMQPIDQDGRYRAAVPLPGRGPWKVRLTSVEPESTFEIANQTPPTTAAPTTTQTTTPTTTTTEADRSAADESAAAADSDDGGGGASTALFIGIVVVLAAGGILGVRAARRSREREKPA